MNLLDYRRNWMGDRKQTSKCSVRISWPCIGFVQRGLMSTITKRCVHLKPTSSKETVASLLSYVLLSGARLTLKGIKSIHFNNGGGV